MKDKGAKATNKCDTSKCIYTIQSLQNKRTAESEIFVTRWRLYVQARSKGCILSCSFTEKLEEIRSVSLVINLYEFLRLCFGLGPAPRIFTKLLKIEIPILCRINIRMIIYLDGMLLTGHSIEEISMCRDTVIFLLQHLGFVINWKKSVLTPVQEIEFLGLKINSVNLEISLTEEKIQKVKTKCQNLLTEPATSILELTSVIGLLTSTIQAVLLARLQLLVTSAAANTIFKGKPFISARNSSEPPIKSRTTVVDNKSRSLQWPIINSASCTGSYRDRCFNKGLGGNLQ